MTKILILASAIGLAAGVIYWLCKQEKSTNSTSETKDRNADYQSEHQSESQEEKTPSKTNIVEEMCQAKSESVQAISERHSAAGEIMRDAYSNIMEDFVEDFSDEKITTENKESNDVIIDSESISVMKEIDSISDELDDLLK